MRKERLPRRWRVAGSAAVALLTIAPAASANNGAIAFAYPIEGVVIDGHLAEWAPEHRRFAVRWTGEPTRPRHDHVAATFRVAYDAKSQHLYLALEVEDDSHVVQASGALDWLSRDGHLVYVDKQHRPGGSGGVLYIFSQGVREFSSPLDSWDPANAEAGWQDAEVATLRSGTRTTYEWRISLHGYIVPGRSIGLDHLVTDKDADREDPNFLVWGAGFEKSRRSYRLGDVVLLGAGTPLGELEGTVGWAAGLEEPLPSHVRLTATEHPDLWVQARVEDGRYRVTLPPGSYAVSSAFTLSKPFRVDFNNLPRRVNDTQTVQAQVLADRTSAAPHLAIRTFDRPDYLFARRPVLPSFEAADSVAVDTFVEAFRRYYDVPGVSLALVHGGELVYHRTFGVKNHLTREPLAPQTLFEGASITKAVFAFAVMRLVEQGSLDLDRPLHQYLPFHNIADDPRSRGLTARMVLTHHSGLPNWAWGGPGGWRGGDQLELLFEPGSEYFYSGEAFDYLGRVVAAVTGVDQGALLRREVSAPMGLRNTYYALDEAQAAAAAVGHFNYYPVWKPRAAMVSPASSIHTEAGDFSRFLIGVIAGRGLERKTYEAMLSPHASIPEDWRLYDDGWEQSIGLGVFLRDTPYGRLVEHGGNNDDFDSKFAVVPNAGFGYAIFTNSNAGDELIRAVELFLLRGRPQ